MSRHSKRYRGWILYSDDATVLRSEKHEAEHLILEGRRCRLDMERLHPAQFDLLVDTDDENVVFRDGKKASLPDFVLPRTGAGTDYWTFALLRQLETLGLRVFNGSDTIATVKDKLRTHQLLAQNNIPTPKTMLVNDLEDLVLVKKHLGLPVVVKTLAGSHGAGVFFIPDEVSFRDFWQFTRASGTPHPLILQEFVEDAIPGRDLRVLALGGKMVGCMERRAAKGKKKANIDEGGKGHHFENKKLRKAAAELAAQVTELLGLEIAGIDLLFHRGSFKVCEANSSPGFTGIEKFTGTPAAARICEYIRDELEGSR